MYVAGIQNEEAGIAALVDIHITGINTLYT